MSVLILEIVPDFGFDSDLYFVPEFGFVPGYESVSPLEFVLVSWTGMSVLEVVFGGMRTRLEAPGFSEDLF